MGQESSALVDDTTAPSTLKSRDLNGVASYIKSGKVKKIVVMTGAGISTSAGIPDFRSPDTGLYANLARLNLNYAEAVFDISFFRQNPLPFYTLAHELYPGRYRPTITHSFISLLARRGLLLKHFTQNIDCLDLRAGVPPALVIEAHGSFARQSCIECKAPYPDELMRAAIEAKEPPRCENGNCGGLVKPEIVFFGEALPPAFFEARELPGMADLCIVMGTSLTVQPFASLPGLVGEETPRVLINKEIVGGMGSRPDDVLVLGDCDDGVRRLANACGWGYELEEMWKGTAGQGENEKGQEEIRAKTKDEELEDEVEKLTREVGRTLSLGREHEQRTRDDLDRRAVAEQGKTQPPEADIKEESKDTGGLKHVFPWQSKLS